MLQGVFHGYVSLGKTSEPRKAIACELLLVVQTLKSRVTVSGKRMRIFTKRIKQKKLFKL